MRRKRKEREKEVGLVMAEDRLRGGLRRGQGL
jgi:hypothetical protein